MKILEKFLDEFSKIWREGLTVTVSNFQSVVRNAPLSRAIVDSIRSQETFVESVFNMRANAQGNQGPEREAFKVQFGEFSNESLAAIAQNITERLWMDEDDFQVRHNCIE